MATELTFAKTFLSLLDSKPPKISPDHVEDPRTYPGTSPYTLPRHPSQKPFSKRKPATNTNTSTTTTGSATPSTGGTGKAAAEGVTVTCTSPRNPAFTLALAAQHPATSLAEVKEQVARETGLALGKIKLLFGKKPVGDSKVLADLLSSSSGSAAGGELELGVMVLGGGVLRDGFGTSTSTSASTSGQAQAQSEAAKVEGAQTKVEEAAAAAAARLRRG
ncbi:hypothetical protein NEMBOFW57_009721 [Staphylotrichum longicolle]|uniref:Get5 N-terminal domain-containing protein n=1 Tax=Staphylotrichum longicolle TaxID=669026 RepID=A0AAD4EPI8_9PEZI|nr:hypothetical protein NEMBOFW57_009721 [Staphylotrichum longicolle]